VLRLHPNEFADALAMPSCFIVAHDHQPAGSTVVRERPEYLIVRVGAPRD
jgi:hypothetical protein